MWKNSNYYLLLVKLLRLSKWNFLSVFLFRLKSVPLVCTMEFSAHKNIFCCVFYVDSHWVVYRDLLVEDQTINVVTEFIREKYLNGEISSNDLWLLCSLCSCLLPVEWAILCSKLGKMIRMYSDCIWFQSCIFLQFRRINMWRRQKVIKYYGDYIAEL